MEPTTQTFFDVLGQFAKEQPNKSLYADPQRDYSALAFYRATLVLADFLRQKGVKPKDLVFVRATRSIDTILLFVSLTFVGAAVALSDAHQDVDAFIAANEMGDKVAFTLSNEKSSADLSASGGWILTDARSKVSCPCPIPDDDLEATIDFEPRIDLYAPSAIIFTSGSSSKAKAVGMSQYNLLNHLRNYVGSSSLAPEDNALMLLPTHHVFGLCEAVMALCQRYRLFFAPALDFETSLKYIQEQSITRLDSIPAYLMALAKLKIAKGVELPSLNASIVGGTALIKDELKEIENILHITIAPVYGMSECIGIAAVDANGDEDARLGSVGRFLPMCDAHIIDDDGNDVPEGEPGEIIVKAPSVMVGYYGDPEGTKAVIDENGYLHTGDLGRLDERGLLHIVGRKKEIIIRNGNNLSPAAIEEKILKTGKFKEIAVFGVKDQALGEVPIAVVVPNQEMNQAEIEALLVQALPKIEVPARVHIVDALPRLSSGKVDKVSLKERFK